ncbi:Iron-sulfur cluster assembly accessory protein OS=Streptomyces alboniger OX=132473 GN=CP975_09500 PE=4 SV=1 [Streptomyces alboniger]
MTVRPVGGRAPRPLVLVPGRRHATFVDTIEKQGFTIDNPNATGSCACGDSFS